MVGSAGVVSGTHLPAPVLLPWPKSVPPERRPRRKTWTVPDASGDCASDVIGADPVHGICGTNL